ncbi:MAG TPA: hypothetical protein VF189_03035 [Patescibacteria group bacterium]
MVEQEFELPKENLLKEAEKLKVGNVPTDRHFTATYTIPGAEVAGKPVNIEFSFWRREENNKPSGSFFVRSEATYPIPTTDYGYYLSRSATPSEILLMVRLLTYRFEAQKEDFQAVGRASINESLESAKKALENARKVGLGDYIQARKRWSSINSQAAKALPHL